MRLNLYSIYEIITNNLLNKTSKIDLYEKMWSIIKNNNIKNMSEGFDKVRYDLLI